VTQPDRPTTSPAQPAFDELGRLSFAEHSLDSVVNKVAQMATRFLPGEPGTSVTVLTREGPRTVAVSGDLARQVDSVQYRLGDGPCLRAATTGEPARIRDTRAPEQWPEFAQEAAALGVDSILSLPLPVQERVSASLNVYARELSEPDPETLDLVARFAAYAVIPVSNMYLYENAVERAGHLAAALDSRPVIDQAKGILMERYKLTADTAFRMLARVSMEHNIKVRDVAEEFVRTGQLPPY
jgi:GAF domain-containing protein